MVRAFRRYQSACPIGGRAGFASLVDSIVAVQAFENELGKAGGHLGRKRAGGQIGLELLPAGRRLLRQIADPADSLEQIFARDSVPRFERVSCLEKLDNVLERRRLKILVE